MAPELSQQRTIGLVLAGGHSSRMGQNKALLARPDAPTQTLLMRMQSVLRAAGCADVLISGAAVGGLPDRVCDAGPLAGIDSALAAIPEDDKGRQLLIVPVDMPALTPVLLQQLISVANSEAAPKAADHPLLSVSHAWHFEEHMLPLIMQVNASSRCALASVLQCEQKHSIYMLLQTLGAQAVTMPVGSEPQFLNVNTPADWLLWSQLQRAGVCL